MKILFRAVIACSILYKSTMPLYAQPAMQVIHNLPVKCLTYNNAVLYKGEVNSKSEPDGFGTCVFADSSCYTGEFMAGTITGEGAFMTKNPVATIKLAQWQNGIIKGQYFYIFSGHLTLRQRQGNLSYPIRVSGFTEKYLTAVQYNGSDTGKPMMNCFLLNTSDVNDATDNYSPTDTAYQMDGVYASYSTTDMQVSLLTAKNGDYTGDFKAAGVSSSYRFLDPGLTTELAPLLHYSLPAWLTGADYFIRDDNKEKFFGSQPAVNKDEGSYAMQYGSDGSGIGYLRVSKLSKWLTPFGFIQEIFRSGSSYCRMMMGDINLENYNQGMGTHKGNGVVMNNSTVDQGLFDVSAGDIEQGDANEPEKSQYLHSGFLISHSGNNFFVTIGNWDSDNHLGKGYAISVTDGNLSFFRGNLNTNRAAGEGELLLDNGKTAKINMGEDGTPILQTDITAFTGISKPALFQYNFDVDMK